MYNADLMTVVNCTHHLSEDVLGLLLLQTAHFVNVASQISLYCILHYVLMVSIMSIIDDVAQLDDV